MQNKPEQRSNKLRKVLGVAFGLSVVIGGTIGAGILRNPSGVAALLPDARLILFCWILIGLLILLSASSYAELTTMLPKAGGAYNYIKRAFGNYAGFINGWFDFLSNAIAPAYFCIMLAEYGALLFPALSSHQTAASIGILTLFMGINLAGVQSGSITQQVTSVIKMVLFLGLIVGCFLKGGSQSPALATALPGLVKGSLVIAMLKAVQLIIGTYDGWMSVSFFAEEDQDPGKNIPRSYLLGALTVILLYVCINAALLYTLPVSEIARSPLPAAKAATIAFGHWGAFLMTLISIFSLLSILNAYMMIPPRILFGMSRDGFFFRKIAVVNSGGTPYYALLCCYALAVVLIIFSSFEQLFALGAFMMNIVTAFAFASLIRLRKKEPDLPRPYRVWGYPVTTYIALVMSIALFIGFALSDHGSLLIIAGFMLVSFPLYRLLQTKGAETLK